MHSIFQIFAEPENPVLSLEVQARAAVKEVPLMNRFAVLLRHFFVRFFDNQITSLDGQNGTRVIQVLCAIAVPGLIVALELIPSYFIFPPNTAPRAFWPRVSDHYFFVMYSMVVTGAVTVFEWDLLFPDLIDILVLTPLPVLARKLFAAKIAALAIFLGLFLAGSSILGTLVLPMIAGEPSLFRHFMAHFAAVTMSGLFASAFFIALQGILLNIFGERFSRWISPALQGLSLAALLIVLFLCPLLSQSLRLLLTSGSLGVHCFPPFWFLGIYERLLRGPAALPVFHGLAMTGVWASLVVIALACLTYPLAYRRKTRSVTEGQAARNTHNWFVDCKDTVLHAVFLLKPPQRAVYHFVSQTLKRAPRHRVYLSIYGGIGLALVIAETVAFKLDNGHVQLVFSAYGLRAAIPLTAFWLVTGLKAAFMSPVELKANWLFQLIDARPNIDQIASTQRWTLMRALAVTAALVLLTRALNPVAFGAVRQMAAQLLLAQGLCLLLIDTFFLRFMNVPFTAPLTYSRKNMAIMLMFFLVLFPPYIWMAVDAGLWIERSAGHFIAAFLLMLGAHIGLQWQQRKMVRERAGWSEFEDADEFPQRLGLL